MGKPIGGEGRSGACRVWVGGVLDRHLGRLADEVVLRAAGHQMHHVTCSVRASQNVSPLQETYKRYKKKNTVQRRELWIHKKLSLHGCSQDIYACPDLLSHVLLHHMLGVGW